MKKLEWHGVSDIIEVILRMLSGDIETEQADQIGFKILNHSSIYQDRIQNSLWGEKSKTCIL